MRITPERFRRYRALLLFFAEQVVFVGGRRGRLRLVVLHGDFRGPAGGCNVLQPDVAPDVGGRFEKLGDVAETLLLLDADDPRGLGLASRRGREDAVLGNAGFGSRLGRLFRREGIEVVESRGHDGYLHVIVIERRVESDAPDDVGRMRIGDGPAGLALDRVEHGLSLVEADLVLAVGEVHQKVAGSLDLLMVEQRRCQGGFGGLDDLVRARCAARTHDGQTAVGQYGAHIGEVHVDEALARDQLGDTLGGGGQDVVRLAEGLLQRQGAVDFGNVVVVDHHQRVDVLAQLLQSPGGLVDPFGAFVAERQRDDAHRQDAAVAGRLGDDGRSARSRAATHAGRDEDHLGSLLFEAQHDVVQTLDGGLASLFGVVACSQTFAQQDLDRHGAGLEGLPVGVADHEGHVGDPQVVHVVHGIAAGTAHTQHHDDGGGLLRELDTYEYFVFVCHHRKERFRFRRRRPRRRRR